MDEKIKNEITDLLNKSTVSEFYKKLVQFVKDFCKPTADDIFLISQEDGFVGNANKERIKKFKVLNAMFNRFDNCNILPETFFHKLTVDENEPNIDKILNFWRIATRQTELEKIIGFPLTIYSNSSISSVFQNTRKYHLYFLKNPEKKTTTLYSYLSSDKNDIYSEIFQKLFIFYKLYKDGAVSENYIFEEISNNIEIKTTFCIQDLYFTIPLKKIIILSPKTKLTFTSESSQYDYFNYLDKEESKLLKETNCETFIEMFVRNFQMFFQTSLYNTKNLSAVADVSRQETNLKEGKLYIVKNKESKNYVYTIILTKNETHLSVMFLYDSTIKNTFSSSIRVFSVSELKDYIFIDPNFLPVNSEYTIGGA